MNIRKIDDRFSTAAQPRPDQMAEIAAKGFVAIVCARPDREDPGQPSFVDIARAADAHGIRTVHIPMSGAPATDQVASLREAMSRADGPVLGYCRSGARSASLYAALGRQG